MTSRPHVPAPAGFSRPVGRTGELIRSLNTTRHRRAVTVLMAVTLAHWAEHIFQAVQVFALGWARPEARGALGAAWPVLVSSEWLHYGYAIAMMIGLLLLRPGFTGTARTWWNSALIIQVWHHLEHLLLLGQALAHRPLFGATQPTSLVQLILPRVELHLFYNAIVFTPMLVAVFLQFRGKHDAGARAPRRRPLAQPRF